MAWAIAVFAGGWMDNPKITPTDEPQVTVINIEPGLDWSPVSDYSIEMIHAGLLIPNKQTGRRMAREIRKWRGVEHPDWI